MATPPSLQHSPTTSSSASTITAAPPPPTTFEKLERFLSRPLAKPYRTSALPSSSIPPTLTPSGHLAFAQGDLEDPKSWSIWRRWIITILAILLVVNATFASSSPSGCLKSISDEFNVSIETSGLVITLFLLGYSAGPLVFAPLSEFYGRRWVFYFTFLAYIAFTFLCAFTPSFAGLLVGRFATGTLASAPLTNAPGVLADVWGPVERGNAMAVFSMMTFIGPALGPVVGGFVQLRRDWRWMFYVLLWLGGGTCVAMLAIPETLPSQVLVLKARRLRRAGYSQVRAEAEGRSLKAVWSVALVRPWKILVDPISALVAIYLSIVYSLLYMLFTIYPIVFQQKRGWNSGVGELPLIGTVIGACIGGAMNFWVSAREKRRLLAGGAKGKAEDRLPLAMVGGVMFAVTMFWFAWTAEFNSIHWIVPTIAGVFLATSILLIFVAYLNYLTDTYLMYTASAMAANTICRSACGAVAPLYTQYMFDKLGVGGGGSLIGGVAVLLAPIPFVFYKYGQEIREKSKFAPTPEVVEKIESNEISENPDDVLGHDDEEAVRKVESKKEEV